MNTSDFKILSINHHHNDGKSFHSVKFTYTQNYLKHRLIAIITDSPESKGVDSNCYVVDEDNSEFSLNGNEFKNVLKTFIHMWESKYRFIKDIRNAATLSQ